jgi:uncharacterized caspase-like protein
MVQTSRQSDGQKRAVLIGVNHYYLDGAIGNLKYCVNDVKELDSILSNELRGGFSTVPLCSGEQDSRSAPNRSNILALVKLLATNSEENDTILVYFAGHGFNQAGKNYILPADARIDVIVDTAIRIKWIKDILSESLAKKKMFVIDACHAGAKIGRASVTMTRSFEEELYRQSEGFAILASCAREQVSYDYDEKNHGVFSYFLLEGLRGAADGDRDGIITVPDVNKYVASKIREWCMRNRLQQNPTLSYKVAGDFIMVRVPSEGAVSLSASFTIKQKTDNEEAEVKRICEIVDELRFGSLGDVLSDHTLVEELTVLIAQEQDWIKKAERGKVFLKTISERRFSTKWAKQRLMPIVDNCVDLIEIKKWIAEQEKVRKFLMIEFAHSDTFDFAGTMARIIEKLLPAFSDEEILSIVRDINGNDQITASFKARGSLVSIVDACRGLMAAGEYSELRKSILGD